MVAPIVEAFSLSHAQIMNGVQTFLQAALAQASADEYDVYGVDDASISPKLEDYENKGDDAVLSEWNWLEKAEVKVRAGYLSFPLIGKITGQTAVEVGPTAAVNEVQTITVTGTAGTFTLAFGTQTTAAIAFNASTAAVQTALLLLTNLDDTDVVVTGAVGSYVVTFGGKYAGTNVAAIVANGALLTAGTATVVTTTPGAVASSASASLDLWHEDSMNTAPKPMLLKMPSKDMDGAIRILTIGLYKVQFKPITFDGPKYKDGMKVNYEGNALMAAKDEQGVLFADGKKRVGRLISHT